MSGEIEHFEVAKLASGMVLRLPLHRLEGAAKGPVLGITAAIHGDEVLPIEIIRQLLQRIDKTALRGRILMLPVANPLAFESCSRSTPVDMLNLNRIFPGSPNGWLSERIANVICEQFMSKVNFYLDIHSGGNKGLVDFAFICSDRQYALSLGLESYHSVGSLPNGLPSGTSLKAAQDYGVEGTAMELGGSDISYTLFVEKGVRAVLNLLRHLKMLDGSPILPKEQRIFTNKAVLRTSSGGILYSKVGFEDLGSIFPKGTLLGEVISPYDFEVQEQLTAPFDENLLLHVPSMTTVFEAGEFAFQVGDMKGAEVLRSED